MDEVRVFVLSWYWFWLAKYQHICMGDRFGFPCRMQELYQSPHMQTYPWHVRRIHHSWLLDSNFHVLHSKWTDFASRVLVWVTIFPMGGRLIEGLGLVSPDEWDRLEFPSNGTWSLIEQSRSSGHFWFHKFRDLAYPNRSHCSLAVVTQILASMGHACCVLICVSGSWSLPPPWH